MPGPLPILTSMSTRRALIASGAALVVAGATAGMVAARTVPTQAGSVASRVEKSAPGTFSIQVTSPEEMNERQKKWTAAMAARLGVSTDRYTEAAKATNQELGLPPGFCGEADVVFGFPMPLIAPFTGETEDRIVLRGGHGPMTTGISISAGNDSEAIARAIGISVEQSRTELRDRSLADVARSHGVDPAQVIAAQKAETFTRLEKQQAAGRLSPEIVAEMKQDLSRAIERMIDRKTSGATVERVAIVHKTEAKGTLTAPR